MNNEGIPKSTHAVCNIFERDGHLHSIFWLVEINQYQQSRNALTFLAEHDALTGVYNRHKLDNVMEKMNATQLNRDEIFYILFDLDDFKNINDMYGHSNGDRALAAFAKRLESVFFHKTYNSVFRLGGDEFLVIATHVDEGILLPFIKDAGETIDVILDDGNTIKVRGSIGYGHELDAADEMLYTVKGNKKSIN